MAADTSYQAVTVIALLVGAALIITLVILYTQNQNKWSILDPAQKALIGPASLLGFSTNTGTNVSSGLRVASAGKTQFAMFIQAVDLTKPYSIFTSPQGDNSIAMTKPPASYT